MICVHATALVGIPFITTKPFAELLTMADISPKHIANIIAGYATTTTQAQRRQRRARDLCGLAALQEEDLQGLEAVTAPVSRIEP